MGKLVLFRADGTAQEIKLDRERITIGRRPDNDVCLPQPAVSGEHAAVVTILADSFLEDLGSTNGTLVNGKAGHQALPARPRRDRHRPADPGLPRRRFGDARGAGRRPEDVRRDRRQGRARRWSAPPECRDRGAPERRAARKAPIGRAANASDERWTPSRSSSPRRSGAARRACPTAPPGATAVAGTAPARRNPEPVPAIRVLSGRLRRPRRCRWPSSETLIGRAGVQVVALRRDGRRNPGRPDRGRDAAQRQRRADCRRTDSARRRGYPRNRRGAAGTGRSARTPPPDPRQVRAFAVAG